MKTGQNLMNNNIKKEELCFGFPDWFKNQVDKLSKNDWREIHKEAARLKKLRKVEDGK